MTPHQKYSSDLESGLIVYDSEQEKVVAQFQRLYDDLLNSSKGSARMPGFLSGLFSGRKPTKDYCKGLYIWGGVGRGKTYLMDLFYDCLPFEDKQRTHFHRFMQYVHSELTKLQGQKNPLQQLADSIATRAKVLCFDEFFVLDIGDAMILAGLLGELFDRGVVLVTTSNIYPDGLYENGLQRERFLPAIELIKNNTRVIKLDSDSDYRLRSLEQANLYLCPVNPETDQLLEAKFSELTKDRSTNKLESELVILDRPVSTRRISGDVVWFEFAELCDGPRSAFDYVEIARLFHTVIISNIPVMKDTENDQARRFVSLIDELYDRKVKLVISAEAKIESIYQGQGLAFAFERTESRLLEMQSHEYLCCAHQA